MFVCKKVSVHKTWVRQSINLHVQTNDCVQRIYPRVQLCVQR